MDDNTHADRHPTHPEFVPLQLLHPGSQPLSVGQGLLSRRVGLPPPLAQLLVLLQRRLQRRLALGKRLAQA
jgi:hypothetical protein